MTRGEARFAHLATALVGATGLVWGWMRYLCEPADEFSVVNHPLEPDVQAAHVLVAPLLVLSLGALWSAHVRPKLRANRPGRRTSGWVLVVVALPMIASGYLLQVAEAPAWRTAWVWTHGLASVAWLVGYLLHQRRRR